MEFTKDKVRRQRELEAESRALGASRYHGLRPMPWKEGDAARKADEEANLPPGQNLLRLAVQPTAEAIRAMVEDANSGKAGRRHSAVKWLELAEPEEVAYLTARVALNGSIKEQTLQSVAIETANAIIDHVDMITFKGKNKAGYNGLLRASRFANGSARRAKAVRKMLESEEARTSIAKREKLLLGTAALELLVEATGLFVLDRTQRNIGHGYTIRPSEAVRRWLAEQHERSALLEPMLLPMVVRPRRWRNPRVGGYLRRLYGRTLVKNRNREYQESLNDADLSLVYDAVNHIQETPWRINERVLEVMKDAWDEGGGIAGLPLREDQPLPGKPVGIDADPDKKKAWKRAAAKVHEANAKLDRERLSIQQKLWIATKFKDEEAIWFPHSLDFRGRIYPLPATGIHPQADDGGKALLEFAHGLPITEKGGYWLAIHIANLFGQDKVPFKERVEWTFDNAEKLLDSAKHPLDGERFWTEADEPWQALAAIFEFAGFIKDGPEHVSFLPIPVDGSNSGLQHFSAMLRDPVGAAAVNLIPSEEPSDIYDRVARLSQERVDADTDPMAAAWKGKIDRTIAKRPTMTYVYSATRFGMQRMIQETLTKLDSEGEPYLGGYDNYEAARYLSHVMFDAIGEVVSAATGAMEWLRDVARIASDAGVNLAWTTPDGLPVQQNYRVPQGPRVQVHWQGRLLKLVLITEGTAIDARGQANGIAPNFVHSLDASHLRALARAAKDAGIKHLSVVHDSFATHAARTDDLVDLLRETFVDQYRPDVLARFRDEAEASLPDAWKELIPPLPKSGDLDLEAVLRAPYLFA